MLLKLYLAPSVLETRNWFSLDTTMNIVITGSTGIAAATAKLAASSGASIFIVSRDEASCVILANEIKASSGCCEYFVGDLIEANTAIAAVQKCLNHYHRIDRCGS